MTRESFPDIWRSGPHGPVNGDERPLYLESPWIRDITITTGLVDTYSTPTLPRLVAAHQIGAGTGLAT